MDKIGKYIKRLKLRMMKSPRSFLVYSVLRILVIITLIRQAVSGNYEAVWICALSLGLFLVPSFLEDKLKIDFPAVFEIIIYIFIFAAEILGEVNNFYTALPGWDTMLHTINGFLCAAIGFSLVYLLNRSSRNIELSPFYMALVGFCFSMTIGICWEFVECLGDLFLGQDMQKDFIVTSFQSVSLDPDNMQRAIAVKDITSTIINTASGETFVIEGGYLDIGILDTMKDLFVNFLGAVVFSAFGYIYVATKEANNGKVSKIVEGLMLKTDETGFVPEDVDKLAGAHTPSEVKKILEEIHRREIST